MALLNKICLNRRKSSFLFVKKPSFLFVKKHRQFLTKFLNKYKILFFFMWVRFYTSLTFNNSFSIQEKLENSEDNSKNPLILFPNQSENLMPYCVPGLYRITCLTTSKVYIGESVNVLSRSRYHMGHLQTNLHDCRAMQADYNEYGFENFTFHVLLYGPEWECKDKRKEKETEILSFYSGDQVYNILHPDAQKNLEKNYRVHCKINNVEYNSIADAVLALGIPESVIRRRLVNNSPGYEIINKVQHGYTPVIVDGVEYESLVAVVEAGLATNRMQVGRRLRSEKRKWRNWNYKYGKKQSNPDESL